MKKQIIAGIAVITCVALCAAVWPRCTKVGDLPTKQIKDAVTAEIEPWSEKTPQIFIYADAPTPKVEAVVENEPEKTETTAEEDTEPASIVEPAPHAISKPAPVSSEPKSGDRAVIDGKPHIWIPGFGWIKDESGGCVGTTVGNPNEELTGNKVGQMGSPSVGSNGDINKQVGIMGGGTVAVDMYENGHKIGIMGSEEYAPHETTAPSAEHPVPTGDIIYIELQPPVIKDSTLPPYKPSEAPPNPQ